MLPTFFFGQCMPRAIHMLNDGRDMNVYSAPLRDVTRGVSVFGTPDRLSLIRDAGCAAAIWQRSPLDEFQAWINALPPAQLPRARVILHPDRVRPALADIARAYETPDCSERDMLLDDAAAMAAIFADVMKAPYLRLRLDAITTNACRKFHVDAITARLVCTYRGTGTQYGTSLEGEDPQQVRTVPTGSPILLRGSLWPAMPDPGLKHRSPPIEGTGETRLVLVIDPVADLEGSSDLRSHHIH